MSLSLQILTKQILNCFECKRYIHTKDKYKTCFYPGCSQLFHKDCIKDDSLGVKRFTNRIRKYC